MKALFAAVALSLASAAFAGTVTVSRSDYLDDTGDGTSFVETGLSLFTLTDTTWVSGSLKTTALQGVKPSIDIESVSLKNTTTGEVLSWVELVGVNWAAVRVGFEEWSFATRQLDAGAWTLNVTGTAFSDKDGQGFSATMELPEPDAGWLALVAVGGALAATRRRKA